MADEENENNKTDEERVAEENQNAQKTSIDILLNRSLESYERLPMLEVVFDHFDRLLTSSLRNFISSPVEILVDDFASGSFSDMLETAPHPAMVAVFKAVEWDNHGLLIFDNTLIYSIIDVLLGGRREGVIDMYNDGRSYTTIERNLIEKLSKNTLVALSSSFSSLSDVTFKFERIETNPRFATIARPQNSALSVKLTVDMQQGKGGEIFVIFPNATLEPIRELLLKTFFGDKFGRDLIWENHLVSELKVAEIKLNAILSRSRSNLNSVLNWKVGDTFGLNATHEPEISFICGKKELFLGKMGKKNGHLAVKIEEITTEGEEEVEQLINREA